MHDSSGWNVNFPKMKSQQRNPREIAASEARTKRYAYGLTESGTAQMPTMLAHPHPPVSSKFDYKGSLNVINLCDLAARLTATAAVQDAALVVRQQRAMGLEERTSRPTARSSASRRRATTSWSSATPSSMSSVEDIEVLLYRLRGNDGCNIKPIVVVTRTPPSVQRLIVALHRRVRLEEFQRQRGQRVGVKHPQVRRRALHRAPRGRLQRDNELLMDLVLLATSVLEACEDTPTGPARAPPQGHPGVSSSKIRVARAQTKGFGSLASGSRTRAKPTRRAVQEGQGPPQEPPRQPRDAPARVHKPKSTWRRWSGSERSSTATRRCPAAARRSTAPGRARVVRQVQLLESGARRGGHVKKDTRGGKIIGGLLKFCGVLDMGAARFQGQLQQVPRAVSGP